MKLKEEFITYKTGNNYVAVTANEEDSILRGMVRNNESADFIFRQLTQDTTEEEIIAAVLEEYDVAEDVAEADVRRILKALRDEGLLDE